MTVPKVVFALYRSQEAWERVCRWAQEMRARSVNDCFKVVFALYRSQEAWERVCRWAREMRARSVSDFSESRLCFYLNEEARERVCRCTGHMWVRARSVNDCFEGRLFPSFSYDLGATATATQVFKKSLFFTVFSGFPFSFRTSHL
jgi:hypothetical protein